MWLKKHFFCGLLLLSIISCRSNTPSVPAPLPTEEIQEIFIESPYQNLKIYKSEDQWRGLFLPLTTSAESQINQEWRSYPFDTDEVENLISIFSKIPENYHPEKEIHVSIKTASGKKEWSFSKENPLRRDILKPSTIWRNKKILNEDSSRVEEIILKQGAQTITLLRNEEGQWFWNEKPKVVISQDWTDSLARKISRLKAMNTGEWIRKNEAGLDPPQVQVLAKIRGQKNQIRVLLGNMKEQDLYYAQIEGLKDWENEIFTVDQETAEKFKTNPSQLLKKDVP